MAQSTGKKITEMFAFVVDEPDGGQGIPAFSAANGFMMPLIGADVDRISSLMVVAQEIANASNTPMRILKFSQYEQIGSITPKET